MSRNRKKTRAAAQERQPAPKHHKVTCTCNPCAIQKMQWLSSRIDMLTQAYKEDHEALEALRQAQEAMENDLQALIKQGGVERDDDGADGGPVSGGRAGSDKHHGP